ncbi:unnamed protein product, partial [Symbiodinium natans]
MLPVGLPQTASEQVATNGALEEGAASTNVFEPNARTPFAAVPFAPQLHMYRQNFQQNIMVGESPEQTRSLLGELEIEAENRHQRFRQAAEYAHDQRIANVEERANRQHEEIVAQLESEIATQRYQFIEANHHLVSELRQQHQVIAFQTEHFSSVSSQITQLRTTLIEEAEENKTQTLNEVGEWFGREHDQAMQQYRLLARESEEEMRRQNDVLQDELSSAERALKLEQDRNASQDTASQAQFPPAVTPATVPQSAGLNVPTAPQFSSPSVIPLSLRAMFSGFGGAATTATPAGPRAPTQAPGTPVPSTGLGGGVSGLAVPMGTPASPAATGVDLIAQTQQALLEAARLLKGDKGGEDDKPKAEGRNALRQGVAGEEIALPEKDRRAACCISIAAAASIRPEGDDPQDGEKDYWEMDFKRGEAIRHHLNYRSTMYKPEMSCPVALEKLKGTAKVIKTLPVAPYTAKESWDWKGGKGGTNDKTPWTGKTVFKIKEQNKKVKFCEKPKVREIPFEGKGYKHSYKVRRYNTCYADAENCPKPDNNDLQAFAGAAEDRDPVVEHPDPEISAAINEESLRKPALSDQDCSWGGTDGAGPRAPPGDSPDEPLPPPGVPDLDGSDLKDRLSEYLDQVAKENEDYVPEDVGAVEAQREADIERFERKKAREAEEDARKALRDSPAMPVVTEPAHFGKVFEICSVKGDELPDGHPQKKWKGRSVFQGNNVQASKRGSVFLETDGQKNGLGMKILFAHSGDPPVASDCQ